MQKVGVVIEIIKLQDKKEQKKYIFTKDQVKLQNSLPMDSAKTKSTSRFGC